MELELENYDILTLVFNMDFLEGSVNAFDQLAYLTKP